MIHTVEDNLFLIDLDQAREGFRDFISSWLLITPTHTILVDPGPRSTIPVLKEALDRLAIGRIDHILLTHIHIDHAGGVGLLLDDFPGAMVTCHSRGVKHMIHPEKLWKASQKVLGDLADLYGEIAPVPEHHIGFSNDIPLGSQTICVVETPGHAPHHLSFLLDDILFAGEVAGVTCPVPDGLYLRPTTPPVFNPTVYKNSLERVASLNAGVICFAHYGMRHDVDHVIDAALAQIDTWHDIVRRHYRMAGSFFEERVFDDIVNNDPLMAHFTDLPGDIRYREREFSLNSIRGIRQYLDEKDT